MYLYNPLSDDFTITYNKNGETKEYTLLGNDFANFDDDVAQNMITHLSNAVFNKRGVKVNHELDIIEIQKEIKGEE